LNFPQTLAAGEPALILTIFGTQTNGYYTVPVASVKSLIGLEQLPPGWTGAQATVGTPTITSLSLTIMNKWTSVTSEQP